MLANRSDVVYFGCYRAVAVRSDLANAAVSVKDLRADSLPGGIVAALSRAATLDIGLAGMSGTLSAGDEFTATGSAWLER